MIKCSSLMHSFRISVKYYLGAHQYSRNKENQSMNEIKDQKLNKLEDRLRELAIIKVTPLLNGTEPYPKDAASDVHGSIMLTLWDYGFVPSAEDLAIEGISVADIEVVLERLRPSQRRSTILEYLLSDDTSELLETALAEAWKMDAELECLTERTSKTVKNFKVMFRSDESKHRGRPHVVAVLYGMEVSISLDKAPRVLAPKGKIRGVAAALKVISNNRDKLVKEWNESRPDDQKL